MTAASLAGRALAPRNLVAQAVADSGPASTQFSVMIWTLNKMGTFEENLERVAQAGYHHVELVGEFKKWSEDDYRRILARMEVLKISVDATSGVGPGFADPSGGDAFLDALKSLIPAAKRLEASRSFCSRVSASKGPPPEASMRRPSRRSNAPRMCLAAPAWWR